MFSVCATTCSILISAQYPSSHLRQGDRLRLAACLLLVSGFVVTLAALILLPALGLRFAFVAAGLAVECLGVGLLTQAHRALAKDAA